MRTLCAAAALCFAATLAAPVPSLAASRHRHALPRAVPLPPERPDISSMFTVIRRGRPVGPDGLAAKPAR